MILDSKQPVEGLALTEASLPRHPSVRSCRSPQAVISSNPATCNTESSASRWPLRSPNR